MSVLGPGDLHDQFEADADGVARKLARLPASPEAAATVFAMVEWVNSTGRPMPVALLEALRTQMDVPLVPGLPLGLKRPDAFIEAVGREALALASEVLLTSFTTTMCRTEIERRVHSREWALPLQTLRRALDPLPDHDGRRGTIRDWRAKQPAYSKMVIKVAAAACDVFAGEVLPTEAATILPADVISTFARLVLRGGDLADETLTDAVRRGVGSASLPTFPLAEEVDKYGAQAAAVTRAA